MTLLQSRRVIDVLSCRNAIRLEMKACKRDGEMRHLPWHKGDRNLNRRRKAVVVTVAHWLCGSIHGHEPSKHGTRR